MSAPSVTVSSVCCRRVGGLTARQCVRSVYQQDGVVGFYRGITASYYGISETVIHFVIYEAIKAQLREWKSGGGDGGGGGGTPQQGFNFLDFMCAGAVSKTIATFVAYPHGAAPVVWLDVRVPNPPPDSKSYLCSDSHKFVLIFCVIPILNQLKHDFKSMIEKQYRENSNVFQQYWMLAKCR